MTHRVVYGVIVLFAFPGGVRSAEASRPARQHQFQGAEFQQQGGWVAEPTLADLHARQRQELRDIQLKHAREYDQMRARTRGLASMEARVRIQNQLNAEQDLEKQEMFARHQAEVCSQFKVGCPKMRLVNPRSGAVRRMD